MVEGPGDVYMCAYCAAKSREIFDAEIQKWAPTGPKPVPREYLQNACSFCGRKWQAAGPLVEGPGAIYVCERCVATSVELFRSNAVEPAPAADTSSTPPDEWNGNPLGCRCSFCGRSGRHTGSMIEGPDNLFLCVRCIDAAAAIVADLRREGKLPPANRPSK
jgi:hypothetical protein